MAIEGSTGNVGIGVGSPSERLTVLGHIKFGEATNEYHTLRGHEAGFQVTMPNGHIWLFNTTGGIEYYNGSSWVVKVP